MVGAYSVAKVRNASWVWYFATRFKIAIVGGHPRGDPCKLVSEFRSVIGEAGSSSTLGTIITRGWLPWSNRKLARVVWAPHRKVNEVTKGLRKSYRPAAERSFRITLLLL